MVVTGGHREAKLAVPLSDAIYRVRMFSIGQAGRSADSTSYEIRTSALTESQLQHVCIDEVKTQIQRAEELIWE